MARTFYDEPVSASSGRSAGALRSLALTTVRRSWAHLATTLILYAAILAWFESQHASRAYFLVIVVFGVVVALYNVRRMRTARAALANPETLASFAEDQARSHRLRGRIFLVLAPLLLVVTWYGALRSSDMNATSWTVLMLATSLLVAGGVRWVASLRRLSYS